ncbi:F-box/LRR-repeat protein At4g14103-like [Papaver somniferum]|uniref:F-box/LRR-repeat protein At4g14103-like n=1 Tax=Papaver somniferum TaxID=3469 RepID=UPI000E6F57D9|nr:F-box/LRR-repeat protein At4g14103-like [Papaver somniferum]
MREAPKDRISNLPESLLYHILSFLGIKNCARTSVLSKRWNYIWTTVTTLHFWNLVINSIPTSSEADKFMDFVDGTLHRHNSSNVDKFVLSCNHQLNQSQLHCWISTVIRGNVKELNLHLRQEHPQEYPFSIPLSLFTCASLVSLELHIQPNICLPKYISFPRLKCLKLHLFYFTDESWNEELFSNSRVLEELILDQCSVSMSSFCISIPTLKILKIDNWITKGNGLCDCILKIDAPRLVTFLYTSPVAKEFLLSNFSALEEAIIDICFEEYGGAELSRLLHAFAHVIYSDHDLSNNWPTFHNVIVRKLNISNVLSTDLGFIGLLKAVPNLESLVLSECMLDEEEEDTNDAEGDRDDSNENDDSGSVEAENNHNNHEEVVSDASECDNNDQGVANEDDTTALDLATTGCLFPHLKSVCFQEFAGNPREISWLKQILRNAKALQMMTICYWFCDWRFANVKSEEELKAEMPSFPRASPGCVIKGIDCQLIHIVHGLKSDSNLNQWDL